MSHCAIHCESNWSRCYCLVAYYPLPPWLPKYTHFAFSSYNKHMTFFIPHSHSTQRTQYKQVWAQKRVHVCMFAHPMWLCQNKALKIVYILNVIRSLYQFFLLRLLLLQFSEIFVVDFTFSFVAFLFYHLNRINYRICTVFPKKLNAVKCGYAVSADEKKRWNRNSK